MLYIQLREVAERKGLNIATVARLTGLHRSTIQALWHNPCKNIKTGTLGRLFKALNTTKEELLVERPD